MLENVFKRTKLKRSLDDLGCVYHITEAGAVRGIADVIGCINGKYFALEVKKSESEARKQTGRIVLQRYRIAKIREHKGFACFVYPENLEEVIKELENYGRS